MSVWGSRSDISAIGPRLGPCVWGHIFSATYWRLSSEFAEQRRCVGNGGSSPPYGGVALRAAVMRLSAGPPGRCAPGRASRPIRNSPVTPPPVHLHVRLHSFNPAPLSRGTPFPIASAYSHSAHQPLELPQPPTPP